MHWVMHLFNILLEMGAACWIACVLQYSLCNDFCTQYDACPTFYFCLLLRNLYCDCVDACWVEIRNDVI